MKLVAALLATFGVGLLAAGLIVGFGVSVSDDRGFDCGSAFKESSDLLTDELTDTMTGGEGQSTCDAGRGSAKPLPIVLIILGATVTIGGVVVLSASGKGQPQA